MTSSAATRPLVVRSIAGPDAGWTRSLGVGRHWIGRAGDLAVADPAVEAHQALLDIDPAGVVRLLHVAGRSATRVDGSPATAWSEVSAGSTIEVGHTRLVVGRTDGPALTPIRYVYAPLDESGRELERFERDVSGAVATAAAAGARRCAESPMTVVVGEGRSVIDVEFRNGADQPMAAELLDHAAQRVLDRLAAPMRPVATDLTDTTRLGVAAPDPDAVVESMLAQLAPERRVRVVVADAATASLYRRVARPVVVIARQVDDLPDWCTAVLDVGATWWATWQPDLAARPGDIVRLHARGRARAQPAPAPGGRSSLRR